jgi:hypothetical protein
MKLVFISMVTTPGAARRQVRRGCARREAMATSSSVISTPPCATPQELVSSSPRQRDLGLATLEALQLEAEVLDEGDAHA